MTLHFPSPRRIDLESYRRLVRGLPAPTRAQREAFPRHVEHTHSWYKRLPLLGPGERFVFFLDPAAGCDHAQQHDGSWVAATRERDGFHHSAIPTREYRELFGHLAFACQQSSEAGSFANGPLRLETRVSAVLLDEQGARCLLPKEIEACAVRLTAMIHPYANQSGFWNVIARVPSFPGLWPDESGGVAMFEQIQRRCRVLVEDESKVQRDPRGRGADAVFADLVEPERRRQRGLMLQAIDRMLAVLGLSYAP